MVLQSEWRIQVSAKYEGNATLYMRSTSVFLRLQFPLANVSCKNCIRKIEVFNKTAIVEWPCVFCKHFFPNSWFLEKSSWKKPILPYALLSTLPTEYSALLSYQTTSRWPRPPRQSLVPISWPSNLWLRH